MISLLKISQKLAEPSQLGMFLCIAMISIINNQRLAMAGLANSNGSTVKLLFCFVFSFRV